MIPIYYGTCRAAADQCIRHWTPSPELEGPQSARNGISSFLCPTAASCLALLFGKGAHLQPELPMKFASQNSLEHDDSGRQEGETQHDQPEAPEARLLPALGEVAPAGLHGTGEEVVTR